MSKIQILTTCENTLWIYQYLYKCDSLWPRLCSSLTSKMERRLKLWINQYFYKCDSLWPSVARALPYEVRPAKFGPLAFMRQLIRAVTQHKARFRSTQSPARGGNLSVSNRCPHWVRKSFEMRHTQTICLYRGASLIILARNSLIEVLKIYQ